MTDLLSSRTLHRYDNEEAEWLTKLSTLRNALEISMGHFSPHI